jgi:hypothetical protein
MLVSLPGRRESGWQFKRPVRLNKTQNFGVNGTENGETKAAEVGRGRTQNRGNAESDGERRDISSWAETSIQSNPFIRPNTPKTIFDERTETDLLQCEFSSY